MRIAGRYGESRATILSTCSSTVRPRSSHRTSHTCATGLDDFFNVYLLPVQVRHGARLVGRWETDDEEVIAVWEYDDMAAYERIDAAVRADPDSARAQQQRITIGPLFTEKHETFARSTVQSTSGQ